MTNDSVIRYGGGFMRFFVCLVFALTFPVFAESWEDTFDTGNPDFKVSEYPAAGLISPDRGSISFRYTPKLKMGEGNLRVTPVFSSGNVAFGINVNRQGKTIPWLLIDTPETGPNYGIYNRFPIENGKEYLIVISWNGPDFALTINGKVTGKAKAKTPLLPWGKTFFYGGSPEKKAPGIFKGLKFSEKTVLEPVVRADKASAKISKITDKEELCSFVLECPEEKTILAVRPALFRIRKGNCYWIETHSSEPFAVVAETDDVLNLDFAPTYRNFIVISNTKHNLFSKSFYTSYPFGWRHFSNKSIIPGWNHTVDDFARITLLDNKGDSSGNSCRLNGINGIRLSKTAPLGSYAVMSPKIRLEPGKTYLATAFYKVKNLKYGSMLNLFAVKTFHNSSEPRLIGFSNYSANTPDDSRSMAYCRIVVPKNETDAEVRFLFTASGNPFDIVWEDMDIREHPVLLKAPDTPQSAYQKTTVPLDREALLEKLRQRDHASIELYNGRILLNGKAVPKVGYLGFSKYPHHTFYNAGVRLLWLETFGGIGSWRGKATWLGKGKYDFSTHEQFLQHQLSYAPDATFLLYQNVAPYEDFIKNNKNAAVLGENGNPVVSWKAGPGGMWPSYSSATYREEVSGYLKALCEWLKTSPYGKAVGGIHITGGDDGQFLGFPCDTSEDNRKAFAAWLRNRYGTEDALQKAWGDPGLTFETVQVPHPGDLKGVFFLDPIRNPKQRKYSDYERFRNISPVDTLEIFAKTVKENIGRPFFISIYYSDIMGGFDLGKCALKNVLESPYIDGIVGVNDYGWNRLPGRPGGPVNVLSSPKLHGKNLLGEIDYRTVFSELWGPVRGTSSWDPKGVGVTRSAKENTALQRRDFAHFLIHGQGVWNYAIAGNGWPHPDMMAAIEESVFAGKMAAEHPMPEDHGDIVRFIDERMLDYYGKGEDFFKLKMNQAGASHSKMAYFRCGVKTDEFLFSDMMNPDMKKYKMYVFQMTPDMTEEEIRFIETNLQKDGNTLVFLYDAGRITKDGFNKTIKRLSGISVRMEEKHLVNYSLDTTGCGSALAKSLSYIGFYCKGPAFIVTDKDAEILAYYEGTNIPAAAVKRQKDWTGIYVGCPNGVTPDFLNLAARESGIQPVGPVGDATYAGNGFIAIHAMSDGTKTIRWQTPSDLIDIQNNKCVAGNAVSFSMEMKTGETRFFRRVEQHP